MFRNVRCVTREGTHIMENTQRLTATLALMGAVILWGSSFVFMKIAVTALHPFVVVWGRMTIAACALLLFSRRFRNVSYRRGDWKWFLIMTLFEPCLYFICEAYALQNTSASQAGMITALLPLMVTFGAWMFLKERVGLRTLAGFVLCIIGVIWLSLAAGVTEHAPNPLLGNTLEFLAMVCASGYMVIMKYLSSRYNALFITTAQAVAGALFFLPLLLFPQVHFPQTLEWEPIAAVLFLGSVVTIGGYGLYNYGTSCIAASQASIFINLIPVIAVVCGWALLGEHLNTSQYAASFLVLAGVFLSQQKK